MKRPNAKPLARKLGIAIAIAAVLYGCLAYVSLSGEFRNLGLR